MISCLEYLLNYHLLKCFSNLILCSNFIYSQIGIEKDQPIEITPHQREEQILLAHRTNKDFFNTFRPEDNMNIRAEKILLNRIGNNLKSFPKKQYDFDQIMVVKRLIISYFSILKKQIKDLIQKCMVCKFFNKIDKMNLFITEKLFSAEIEIKDLLLETEAVTIERRRLDKRIGVLRVCLRALNRSSNTELEEDRIILEERIQELRAFNAREEIKFVSKHIPPSNFKENEEKSCQQDSGDKSNKKITRVIMK